MDKKRETRNKARDVIGDYWRANREINEKDYEATRNEKGKPLKINEKIWIAVIVVGAILIVLKYFVWN